MNKLKVYVIAAAGLVIVTQNCGMRKNSGVEISGQWPQ